VLEQTPAEEGSPGTTMLRFVEVNNDGSPIGPAHDVTIEGDVVYIDAWVGKFHDQAVEEGDPLRGTSVCLFRRLFGEFQKPNEGFVIDNVGSRPTAYERGGEMSDLESRLWGDFWDYATDQDKAAGLGLRAAHGEAPSIKLIKGKLYKVSLRASGGLTIETEDLPAALRDPST
jgi:hypothetical protein